MHRATVPAPSEFHDCDGIFVSIQEERLQLDGLREHFAAVKAEQLAAIERDMRQIEKATEELQARCSHESFTVQPDSEHQFYGDIREFAQCNDCGFVGETSVIKAGTVWPTGTFSEPVTEEPEPAMDDMDRFIEMLS